MIGLKSGAKKHFRKQIKKLIFYFFILKVLPIALSLKLKLENGVNVQKRAAGVAKAEQLIAYLVVKLSIQKCVKAGC